MNIYKNIIKGLNEAIEYEKGSLKAKQTTIVVKPFVDFEYLKIKKDKKEKNK